MKKDDQLIQDVKTHLDQSVQDLDPGIVSKITQSRYKALVTPEKKWVSWGIPITGLAGTAAIILLVFTLFFQEVGIETDQLQMVEMLESEHHLDLFENLDFYAWLAEQPNEDPGT